MAFPQRWQQREQMTTIAIPKRLKDIVMAIALLIDRGDPEILEIVHRRFLDKP